MLIDTHAPAWFRTAAVGVGVALSCSACARDVAPGARTAGRADNPSASPTLVRVPIADDSTRALIGRIGALAIGTHGDLFVADIGLVTVRQFDGAGRFVRPLGRSGRGPGEYTFPSGIAIRDDGRVFVRNAPVWLNQYDASGRVLPAIRLPLSEVLGANALTATGHTLVAAYPIREPGTPLRDDILRIHPDSGTQQMLRLPRTYTGRCDGGIPVGGERLLLPYTALVAWAAAPDGAILIGCSDRYEIEVVGGRLNGAVLSRPHEAVPVPEEERSWSRQRIINGMRLERPDWQWPAAAEMPHHLPAFRLILPARDGRIFVIADRAGIRRDVPGTRNPYARRYRLDAFDRDGRFRGSVDLPAGLLIDPAPAFADSTFWAVEELGDGAQRLAKFALTAGPSSR